MPSGQQREAEYYPTASLNLRLIVRAGTCYEALSAAVFRVSPTPMAGYVMNALGLARTSMHIAPYTSPLNTFRTLIMEHRKVRLFAFG